MMRIAQISETRGGKVLVALWVMTVIILLVTPAATWLWDREELLGNIIYSLLVVSILANISNILVCIFQDRGLGIARATWVGLCFIALLLVIGISDPSRPDTIKDAGTILAYLMLTLSFPIGFLGVLLLVGLNQIFSLGDAGPYTSNLIAWLLLIAFGYIQWFLLLPYLTKRIRKDKNPARFI